MPATIKNTPSSSKPYTAPAPSKPAPKQAANKAAPAATPAAKSAASLQRERTRSTFEATPSKSTSLQSGMAAPAARQPTSTASTKATSTGQAATLEPTSARTSAQARAQTGFEAPARARVDLTGQSQPPANLATQPRAAPLPTSKSDAPAAFGALAPTLLPPPANESGRGAEGRAATAALTTSAAPTEAAPAGKPGQVGTIDTMTEAQTDGMIMGAGGKLYDPSTPLDQIDMVEPRQGAPIDDGKIDVQVNGILTDASSQLDAMQHLADAKQQSVIGVRNATGNFVSDAAEFMGDAFFDGLGYQSKPSQTVETLARNSIETGQALEFHSHSQGAPITSNALKDVREGLIAGGMTEAEANQAMNIDTVNTYGGAETGFPDGPKYTHNINRLDPVSGLLGLGNFGTPLAEVTTQPGKDATINRFTEPALNPHAFNTYVDAVYGKPTPDAPVAPPEAPVPAPEAPVPPPEAPMPAPEAPVPAPKPAPEAPQPEPVGLEEQKNMVNNVASEVGRRASAGNLSGNDAARYAAELEKVSPQITDPGLKQVVDSLHGRLYGQNDISSNNLRDINQSITAVESQTGVDVNGDHSVGSYTPGGYADRTTGAYGGEGGSSNEGRSFSDGMGGTTSVGPGGTLGHI